MFIEWILSLAWSIVLVLCLLLILWFFIMPVYFKPSEWTIGCDLSVLSVAVNHASCIYLSYGGVLLALLAYLFELAFMVDMGEFCIEKQYHPTFRSFCNSRRILFISWFLSGVWAATKPGDRSAFACEILVSYSISLLVAPDSGPHGNVCVKELIWFVPWSAGCP